MNDYKLELDFPGQSENVLLTSSNGLSILHIPRFNNAMLGWDQLVTTHYYPNGTEIDSGLMGIMSYFCNNLEKPVNGLGVFTRSISRCSFTKEQCAVYIEKLIMYDLKPLSINFGDLDYSSDPSLNITIIWNFTKADYELKLINH